MRHRRGRPPRGLPPEGEIAEGGAGAAPGGAVLHVDLNASGGPGPEGVAHIEDEASVGRVGAPFERRGHVHDAQPEGVEAQAAEAAGIGQHPDERVVGRPVVGLDRLDQIDAKDVAPEGGLGCGVHRGELMEAERSAGDTLRVGPDGVAGVALEPGVAAVLDVVAPAEAGLRLLAVGDDKGAPPGRAAGDHPGPGFAQAFVEGRPALACGLRGDEPDLTTWSGGSRGNEVGVAPVDAHAVGLRRHAVTKAAVDEALGGGEGGEGFASLADVIELAARELGEDASPPVRGRDGDGGDAGRRQVAAGHAHGQRDGVRLPDQLVAVEGAEAAVELDLGSDLLALLGGDLDIFEEAAGVAGDPVAPVVLAERAVADRHITTIGG